MARVSIFLIIVALIGGTMGCAPPPLARYGLTISSKEGGTGIAPGEEAFPYRAGSIVSLVATADVDYHFLNWTSDADTIADFSAAVTVTTITMNDHYSVTANFGKEET